MQAQRLHDLVADGVERRQEAHRLLVDHADLAAADLPELFRARVERRDVDRLALLLGQPDVARGDVAGPVEHAEDRLGGHRLAAAGFADEADGLAPGQREVDAADDADIAAAEGEVDVEVFDLEERGGVHRPQPE